MTGLVSPVQLLLLMIICLALAAIPSLFPNSFVQEADNEWREMPPAVTVETILIRKQWNSKEFAARVEAVEAVGQVVSLYVYGAEIRSLPVVPDPAVLQDRDGRFVYLLGDDNAVLRRRVETGALAGNGLTVTRGLYGGEKVVVQGIERLTDGVTVWPRERQPVGGIL